MSGQQIDKARVRHLVVAIHGIRTAADWKEGVRQAIEIDPLTGQRDEAVKFELVGYGYFDLLRFLFPLLFMRSRTHDIYSKIRGYQEEYPNATKTSAIAHSLGSYLLAQILMMNPLKLHRIILCASIIPATTSYWNAIRKAANTHVNSPTVRNDCSKRDIWPALASAIWWYGNTGNLGAQFPGVEDVFHSFRGHSEFLNEDFAREYWRPFLLSGELVYPTPPVHVVTPWYTSRFPVVLRLCQVGVVAVALLFAGVAKSPLTAITSGSIGVFTSWGYNLDKDEATVSLQSGKNPLVIGRPYVVLVLKSRDGDIPIRDNTRTVVSKVQRFPDAEKRVVPLTIRCDSIADSISYGDEVSFYAYAIADDKVDEMTQAVEQQAQHGISMGVIEDKYGGIRVAGGADGAAFDENGQLVKCAISSLAERRQAIAIKNP